MVELKNLIQQTEGVVWPGEVNFEKILDEIENNGKELTEEEIGKIQTSVVESLISVSPDLKTFGLAEGHVSRLFALIKEKGLKTEGEILLEGARQFYMVSREVLGPIWSGYVAEVFKTGKGNETYLFAARDATPMYWAAKGILENTTEFDEKTKGSSLVHVDWNRWFMGQEDELDDGSKPISFSDPKLKKFYEQMDFGNGRLVKIVEPGAWGSAANALKNVWPDQNFELWFMFSHMPEYIYGYLNEKAPMSPEKLFELINDTAEGMPKAYVRPTDLIESSNGVVANLKGKVIDSKFMQLWSLAVNVGAYDAGLDYAAGQRPMMQEHVEFVGQLSEMSNNGVWTGVLPTNTLTWTEGENWRKNWPWGKIPPLK